MTISEFKQRFTGGETPSFDDFGLGDKIAHRPGTRLINKDGTFNVARRGQSILAPYKNLVEMSWWRFLGITMAGYLVSNLLFATAFYLLGPENLTGLPRDQGAAGQFLHCFYLSVQTFTTVGYGTIAPNSMATNAVASLLALYGWIALALVTGLFFARFSRPTRLVIFSEKALLTPFRDVSSLQFRIANKRDTSLINVRARVVLTWLEKEGPQELNRRFEPLDLERDFVPLFPLNWTIVHPIATDSPVYGWTEADFCRRYAEILIMVEGYDQTFAQQIHANNSYVFEEIVYNRRFQPMYRERAMTTELFLDRISHTEALGEEE